MGKFDFTESNEDLLSALYLFEDILSTKDNYFGANCQLEIGNNYLRLKEPQTATAFLYEASKILDKCFSDDHPTN